MNRSVSGVLAAAELTPSCAALIAGTNDLAASLRLPAGAGRGPLQMSLPAEFFTGLGEVE